MLEGNNSFITDIIYVMPNDCFENILSRDTCVQLRFITIQGQSTEEESKDVNIVTKPQTPELDMLIKKYNDIFEPY